MSKSLNSIFWHDGNLIDVSFGIDKKGKSTVQISALFYATTQSSKRTAYQIRCEDVVRFNSALDAKELKSNMFAGNISNGYLKEKTLWVYFSDGVLEVHAKKFSVTTS